MPAALDARRRKRPLVRTRFPANAARDLRKALEAYIARLSALVNRVAEQRIAPVLVRTAADSARQDTPADDLRRILDELYRAMLGLISETQVTRLSEQAVEAALNHAAKEARRELEAAASRRKPLGIPIAGAVPGAELSFVMPFTRTQEIKEARVKEMVRLIKTIPDHYSEQVERLVYEAASSGKSYTKLAGELQDLAGVTRNRAQLIAIDQLNRAYSSVSRERAGALGVKHMLWMTASDDRVCFPAGTMVFTDTGNLAIETIVPGDKVLTRTGFRQVLACSKRSYDGNLITVCVGERDLTATPNHPFWVERQGQGQWMPACAISIGDVLRQARPNKEREIGGAGDFLLSNSEYMKAKAGQEVCLDPISLGVPVPVTSVYFKSDAILVKKEIDRISAEPSFLDERYIHNRQALSDCDLDCCLASEFSTATQGTESPAGCQRLATKHMFTSIALCINRWPSALFRTVRTIQAFLSAEFFPAPLARYIFCVGGSTFQRANLVPVRDGFKNNELGLTNGTALLNTRHARQFTALGTKAVLALNNSLLWRDIKRSVTLKARSIFSASMSFLRSELEHAIRNWHFSYKNTLYSNDINTARIVYNLEIAGDHTYYANGFLVHNCPICEPLDGKRFALSKLEEESWPPRHIQCRCSTASDPDELFALAEQL